MENYIAYLGGITLIIISFMILWERRQFKKNGIEVYATVIRTEMKGGIRGTLYFSVLQYNIAGADFETRYNIGSSRPKYSDGETVRIYAHKEDSKKILMPDDKMRIIIAVSLLIGGVSMFIIA